MEKVLGEERAEPWKAKLSAESLDFFAKLFLDISSLVIFGIVILGWLDI